LSRVPDALWLRAPLRDLELYFGPFWEPARPHLPESLETMVADARSLDLLLSRLAARSRLIFTVAVLAAAVASGFVSLPLIRAGRPELALLFVSISVAAVAGGFLVLGWDALWYLLLRVPGGEMPWMTPVVQILRRLTNAFISNPADVCIEALSRMATESPRAHLACLRLTVVPESLKRLQAEASGMAHRTSAST